jgi:hypothetical protein
MEKEKKIIKEQKKEEIEGQSQSHKNRRFQFLKPKGSIFPGHI